MKPAREWRRELADVAVPDSIALIEGRGGLPTLQLGDVYLHSRYRPEEEARRLIDSAELDPARPVVVVGLGLGYHVNELIERGFEVAVIEREPAIAKLALEGPLAKCDDIPIFIGEVEEIARDPAFAELAARDPQCLVHPPSARLAPQYADAAQNAFARAALEKIRLRIAVVGPMFGGSQPIARYLARAFERLGHHALLVDNAPGWPLYDAASKSLKSKKAAAQLANMMLNTMNEWTYARVAEFEPAICIVLAQSPVQPQFPERLRKHGIVTAYWFVENWRLMTYWESIATAYDYFFHIQPDSLTEKLDAAGCKHHAPVATGCDPELHRPITLNDSERAAYQCQLAFAGAGYRNRNHMLAGLTDYGLKIWGVDWHASELHRFVQGGNRRFDHEDFARIAAGADINLNLHASATHKGVDPEYDAINPRVFETAACGGFQLCDACQGLDRFFDLESELPVYRNLQELRERIDYFLDHPEERNAVAKRARERALRDHTYDRRAAEMLEHLIDAHGARIRQRCVHAEHTIADMIQRINADSPLGAFLAKLPADTPFTLDGLDPHIPGLGEPWSEAEGVFAYLRDMKRSSEALLDAFEG
jgi:spore maturation protein CgeB